MENVGQCVGVLLPQENNFDLFVCFFTLLGCLISSCKENEKSMCFVLWKTITVGSTEKQASRKINEKNRNSYQLTRTTEEKHKNLLDFTLEIEKCFVTFTEEKKEREKNILHHLTVVHNDCPNRTAGNRHINPRCVLYIIQLFNLIK